MIFTPVNEPCKPSAEITKHNKNFKVSFRDKVSKHRLVEIIDIESFKEYNLTEETPSTTTTNTVGCCAIV
jgi:hypothetical protein